MDFYNLPVGRIIGIITNLQRRLMDKKFSDVPFSCVETACIGFIEERKRENPDAEIFQKDIEKEFNLRSPTASEMIKNMESKGLIIRESIEGDGRKKRLITTQKGLDCDARIKSRIGDIEKILINGISEEDLQTYKKVSKQMIDNLRMEELNG